MAEQPSEAELWADLGQAEGEERAQLLLDLAERKIEADDLTAAASLLQTAVDVGTELGEVGLTGRATMRLARVLFTAEDPEAAAATYRSAAEIFRDAGWDDQVAEALWARADCLRVLSRWSEMLKVAENGLAVAEADDNDVGVANLGLQRAKALYQLDREEDALTAYRRARDAFRRAGLPSGVADADEFGHQVCMYLGRYDEALELATNCYVLAGTTHTEFDEALAQLRLAETHIARFESDEALAFAHRAKAWFKEHDDSVGVARATRLIARTLSQLDRDREALEAFTEARVLFDANGWDHDARWCEIQRVVHLHSLGRLHEAELGNARLADEFGESGETEPQAWAVMRRMDNLVAAEEWGRASEVAQEWHSSADPTDPDILAPHLRILAFRAYALWKSGDHEEAIRIADEALGLMSDDDFDRGTALLFEVRGRYLMERNDPEAQQQLAHAVALYLAYGSVERAREVSQAFLPELQREPQSKEVDSGAPESRGWSGSGPEAPQPR